jgi:hypothetical protein
LFPGLLREFLHQIDLMVLLSRIAPARFFLSADKMFFLPEPILARGVAKAISEWGSFVENRGNRG